MPFVCFVVDLSTPHDLLRQIPYAISQSLRRRDESVERAAITLTEGGGGRLYRVCSKLKKAGTEGKIAKVFHEILLDEIGHRDSGGRALAALVKTQAAFERAGLGWQSVMIFLLAAFLSLVVNSNCVALDLPPLHAGINDFAAMLPPASMDDLKERLHRFNTETANGIAVLTVKSLDGENIESLGKKAFKALPLSDAELRRSVLLVVARKEHVVGLQAGADLKQLFPEPAATQNLQAQVGLYWDGLRPDLGIYGAVHYLSRVIRGDIRVGSQTEAEKLEDASLHGGAAGAIFAICLGPFLAFFIGGLWGIYATQYGVQRATRLLMGAIFGGATAKLVAMLMSFLGNYSDNLWYFIMALAIPLGVFGSLTEFWMSGDWSGIPRDKGRRRRPEDNMGI